MADKIDPRAERKVAENAEKMLRTAMRSRISSLGFKEHATAQNFKLESADSEAKLNLGKGPGGEGLKYYMNGLSLKMPRHGFIHHYGVSITRESIKGRTRRIPKTTHYNFKNHYFKLPAKDYIDDAINASRVIPYVMQSLTEIRGREIFVNLKVFMERE